jgi:hypothetical protein
MQAAQKSNETITISREKLLSLVSEMFSGVSGNPNPEEPHKPGPWDPIIRKVARQFFGPSIEDWIAGPHPEPWRLAFGQGAPWRSELNLHRAILEFFAARHPEIIDAIGGGQLFSRAVADLNPQPLPPRAAFLAALTQEVIDRALLTQEIVETINQTGDQHGIIIVSGRIQQFVTEIDEVCPRIPKKFPKPKGGNEDRFSALELLTAGAVFEQNAATVANESLQQVFRNAAAKLIETGVARM